MKIKLLRSVLVGDADVMPTRDGTEIDIDDVKAREFVAVGLAEVVGEKNAPPVQNKMASASANKKK